MRFEFGFYSSLLLITFSQGIIYTFLLLKKGIQTANKSNYWLSFFILLCSLYIAPWMLGFAGWYDNQPYRDILFYVPFHHLFFIGPAIYFYTQSLLNPAFKITKKVLFHFLPGMLYILYILVLFVYDKFIYQDYFFYVDGMDKDFDDWYQKLGLLSMVVYFILSLRYYQIHKKLMYQVVSFAEDVLFKWIKTYLIAFLVLLLLPIVFEIVTVFFPELNTYKGSWWFFLFYSIVMYYIAISGYANSVMTHIPYKISLFEKKIMLLPLNNGVVNQEEQVIDIEFEVENTTELSSELFIWKEKIIHLMEDDKIYNDPELTISDVANNLSTNVAMVSKVINIGFQLNFNDFINQHRVDSVKKMLHNQLHQKSTLLGIAFDAGFNSKATFNRAFKKFTGFSPKEYLVQNNL